MALAPPAIVEAPRRAPWARGLMASVPVVTHDDDRFVAGVEMSPVVCDDVEAIDVCTVVALATDRSRPGVRSFSPIILIGRDICSPAQWRTSDGQVRAVEHLRSLGSKAIEAELWTAVTSGANPHLADPTTTIVVAGAQAPAIGLARLVQAIADSSTGSGVIHARPLVVEMWVAANLLTQDLDGRLRTHTGVLVVAGSGYDGTGPNGEAVTATSEWAYATGTVVVHQGPAQLVTDDITAASDTRGNSTGWRVEMGAIAIWDGCLTATVEINPTA